MEWHFPPCQGALFAQGNVMDGLAISPAARLLNEPPTRSDITWPGRNEATGLVRPREVKGGMSFVRVRQQFLCHSTEAACDGLYKECTPPLFIIIL